MAKVLVVEDDDVTRGVIDAILRYEAHEVLLAGNGRQALLMMGESRPDVVLSDIRMPGMSGTEFCRELRRDPDLRETYVILATGFDTPEAKTEGLAAGADDYIGKPIRADELHARIRMGLRIRGLLHEVAELRKRSAELDRVRLDLETTLGKVARLRGDLTMALGSLLDAARRSEEACRQGDLKFAAVSAEKVCREIDEMRSRIAPREGS